MSRHETTNEATADESSERPDESSVGQDEASPRSHALDAWIDGELEIDRKMQVAGWLADDRQLMAELMGLEDLSRQSARLSHHAEPTHNLWPAIAEKLSHQAGGDHTKDHHSADPESRGDAAPLAMARPEGGASTSQSSRTWWPQALAAMLGLAVGAWLMASLGGPVTVPPGDNSGPVATQVSVRAEPTSQVLPATHEDRFGVEAGFLKAREGLWLQLLAHRDALPPETWEAVVENLGILDSAIRDLREALVEDPGNPRLERMLVDNHQRSLDLLHRLARSA